MQHLPDDFESSPATDKDPLFTGDPITGNNYHTMRQRGSASSTLSIMLSVVLSLITILGLVLVLKGQLKQWLEIPDTQQLNQIQEKLNTLSAAMDERISLLDKKVNHQLTINQQLEDGIQQVRASQDRIGKELSIAKNEKVALEEKLNQQKQQQRIKQSQAKPENSPAHVLLVSVRNLGGLPYVSLRDGLDTSPLLAKGDVWREWELVDADPMRRRAIFTVRGKAMELSL